MYGTNTGIYPLSLLPSNFTRSKEQSEGIADLMTPLGDWFVSEFVNKTLVMKFLPNLYVRIQSIHNQYNAIHLIFGDLSGLGLDYSHNGILNEMIFLKWVFLKNK